MKVKFKHKYAKLSQLKVDDRVEIGGGFDCMDEGSIKIVETYLGELYVKCHGEERKHILKEQLADDGDSLIGVYPKCRT